MPALALAVKYWREVLLGLLALALIGVSIYIDSVFKERDQLKQQSAVLTAQLQAAKEMQQMQNRIAEAISQIKIRSNINVSRIESEPAPVFVDAQPIPFIPAGLPQSLYSTATASGRAVTGAPPGGSLPAR